MSSQDQDNNRPFGDIAWGEVEHLYLTCAGPATPLCAEISAILRQHNIQARVFVSGVTAKNRQAFLVVESRCEAIPQAFYDWLGRDQRITGYVFYTIPSQEPQRTASIMAALDAWLQEQQLQIIPDDGIPGNFRVIPV